MPAHRVPRVQLICAYTPCGKPFEVIPARAKEAKFCCRQCQTLAMAAIRWPQTLAERFWSKVAIAGPDECWLWTASLHDGGYGQFQVREDGKLLHDGAHVVSFFLHHGRWPAPGMQALHTCDVRACVNPAHLWEGTQIDNMADCMQKGRSGYITHPETLARGEHNGNAKLTNIQREEILTLYATGSWSQEQLARRYGVHQETIGRHLRKHRVS